MRMLRLFRIIIMLVLYASVPVFAELSVEDLEKIRQIVNESEVRLGERIDDVKKELDTRIEDQGKRITDLRDRINFQGHLIIALIVAIIGFVAVPLSSSFINTTNNASDSEKK